MVTPAGKEFLRNSINNAKFHNRIIEENEMWRQWDLEQGLTMMVSDDVIRKKGHHRCKYHERRQWDKVEKKKSRIREKKGSNKTSVPEIKSDRWDHSGFAELYPDEISQHSASSDKMSSEAKRKKTDTSDAESSKSYSASSADNEVWEDFKKFKRKAVQDRSSKKHSKEKLKKKHNSKHKRSHKKKDGKNHKKCSKLKHKDLDEDKRKTLSTSKYVKAC